MSVATGDKLHIGGVQAAMQNEENACVILITCEKPASDGKMEVKMVYEGDEALASYLLETAQTIILEKHSA